MSNSIIVLILFLYHEAFYLLPEAILVAPGVFRMSDAALVILPLCALTVPKTFSRYKEETWLVITFILLMLLSCLMGSLFFPQSYWAGLLNIRNNFIWLSFFAFVPLIKDMEQVERLVKLLTFLTGVYVLILLATKMFPDLGILHLPTNIYSKQSTLKRFGEFRLFFPYGNIPLMFFFIALAQTLNGYMKESFRAKVLRIVFMFIVANAIVASMTRAVFFPVLFACTIAFISCKKKGVKYLGFVFLILIASYQVLSVSVGSEGGTLLEESTVGKMLFKSSELAAEHGRMFQVNMYLTQFQKAPLTGVGNFAIGTFSNREGGGVLESYKVFGFFNGSDLGYLKILAENGVFGIAWVVWWFVYFYRRGKQTLAKAEQSGELPFTAVLTQGLIYFTTYLLVSGITLGHWVHHNVITILPLSLAIMAIARRTANQLDEQTIKEPSHYCPK
ncbi:MAG: O-antigen ligase family protein [Chlorobium sp.]|nr:O-antigen ligase family protein [Chlorobium sp.]